MKKLLTILIILFIASSMVYAKERIDIQKAKMNVAVDPTYVNSDNPLIPRAHAKIATLNYGPGTFLMDNGYDYMCNGCSPRNVINYGDGTLAIARMGAKLDNLSDRGSWWSFFDGSSWSEVTKVEGARTGWTATAIFSDGRQVVVSHTGNQVNIDALKGFGLWTSYLTSYLNVAGVTDHIWPHVIIDGQDIIQITSTVRAGLTGARFGTYYPVHSWSADQGLSWNHQWIFGDPFTELDTTGGQWQDFNIDDYPIDAFGANKVATMSVPRMTAGHADIWLAESMDNGATWNSKNLTNFPARITDTTYTPTQGVDLVYDNNGDVHIVATHYMSIPDSVGLSAGYHSLNAPMKHWSEANGWTDMVRFTDIPGFNPAEAIFAGTGPNDIGGGNNTLLKTPSIGIDADNNLYVVFATATPGDTLNDGTGSHFYDLFVVGSKDGGATWGPPVNVSNPDGSYIGLEDVDPSVAKLVDDNIHICYHSDPQIGYSSDTGALPYRSNVMYYAYPKVGIPLEPAGVSSATKTTIPKNFNLHQNYPNPFNPTTNIRFDMDKSSRVNLSVYDVTGKLVATLVNGKMNAGSHTITWNAQDMASGVYFAKLNSDNFTAIKKMVLVQ